MTFDQKMALTDLIYKAMSEEMVHGMQIQRGFEDEALRSRIMEVSTACKRKLRDDIVELFGGVE